MQKLILIILFAFIGLTPSNAQFGKLLDKAKDSKIVKKAKELTGDEGNLDISGGLKEALEKGIDEAVTSLSEKDGYLESPYKIMLPEEAKTVVDKLKFVPGFNNTEEKLIQKMNEAAEFAAKEATPIFVDAIKNMSFDDAKKILFGEEDAATRYLDNSARNSLYDAFLPVIQDALDQVNARSYWTTVVEKYNTLPFVKKVNPQLDDHVNDNALNGLFGLIEVKEKGIREDIDQRTSPLLKDVFGQLDNK
ncbi:MAG: DUF4197 domain-containing protein [Saprospiraceae bacterium]|nr:DUF4197 domain-containing protein [Saprospiraceae bacterium]